MHSPYLYHLQANFFDAWFKNKIQLDQTHPVDQKFVYEYQKYKWLCYGLQGLTLGCVIYLDQRVWKKMYGSHKEALWYRLGVSVLSLWLCWTTSPYMAIFMTDYNQASIDCMHRYEEQIVEMYPQITVLQGSPYRRRF